jgi:hypothetical protein
MMEKWRSLQSSLAYLNLHLTKQLKRVVYSVRGRDGKVLFHSHALLVKNAKFIVNEKTRLSVVKEERKAVHAGIRGEIEVDPRVIEKVLSGDCHPVLVYYNPYKVDRFVVGVRAILAAPWVYMTSESDKPKLCLYGDAGGFKYDDTHDPFAWID